MPKLSEPFTSLKSFTLRYTNSHILTSLIAFRLPPSPVSIPSSTNLLISLSCLSPGGGSRGGVGWGGWGGGASYLADEAEHVAMVLPGGERSTMGSWNPAVGQWQSRGEEEGSAGRECVCSCTEQRVRLISVQTHTRSHAQRLKTKASGMHRLSECTHAPRRWHARTFHSVELNLATSRDAAVELFMAARLRAGP